jgi:hypothetical protein
MRRLAPSLLPLVAAAALGCATPAAPPPAPATPQSVGALPDAVDEALARPDRLLQRAEAARAQQKPELAYRYYALIHEFHPASAEDRVAFLWAARIGKRKAEVNLYPDRNSIWLDAERAFVYQWFEEIVREKFSEEHAKALLVDASYDLARHFLAHAAKRPALARWQISVEEDNGRVFAVHWLGEKKKKDDGAH